MFDLLFPKWWSTLKKLIWLKAAALSSAVVKTVTAAIVHIRDALAGPAQNVTIAIEPVQAGTGDPSPDNVRPISGWTGANVYRTGANIWGGEKMADDMVAAVNNASSCKKDSDENGKYVTFTASAAVNSKILTAGVEFKENTQYTFIFKVRKSNTAPSMNMSVKYTDGTSGYLNIIPATPTAGEVYTFSILSTAGKTIEYIYGIWSSGTVYIYYEDSGIFEGVLTAADFQPYTGTTIPIAFPTPPGTVYGGTLDVTTGELTVTHELWTVTDGFSGYAAGTNGSIFSRNIPTAYADKSVSVTNYFANRFKYALTMNTSLPLYGFGSNSGSRRYLQFCVPADVAVSNDAMNTWAANLDPPIQILAPLKTPLTYQLTPQEVQLLKGENNLWADTGNTTLTYLADGRASDTEALNILLAGRYHNSGAADEATDKEALEILLGGSR